MFKQNPIMHKLCHQRIFIKMVQRFSLCCSKC